MNQIIYSIIFIVSLLLGDSPEKHLFKKNTDLIITSDSETFSEMSFGADYMMFTSSMRHNDEYYPVADNKNYEQKMITTFLSVISTTRRNDKVKINYDLQKLKGCIFSHYIDSMGVSDLVEGNNDIAKEMIESSSGTSMIFGGGSHEINHIYPFGDSLRSVGETWQTIEEEAEIEEDNGAMGNYVGITTTILNYTFKKIKEKKGELIAYIDLVSTITSRGTTTTWEEEYEVEFSGDVEAKIRFNLPRGYSIRNKATIYFKGINKNLKTDETNTMFINAETSTKNKYKYKKRINE